MSFIKKLVFLLAFISGSAVAASPDLMIEKQSPLDFDATIEKLIENGKFLDWKLPKKWRKNFQQNIMRVTDVDIGNAQVVEMCEPHAAAKLLVHDQYKKFLSMMPCSIAVYEKSDGKVYMSMMNIRMVAQFFKGQKEIDELIADLAPQMDQMLDMNLKTE